MKTSEDHLMDMIKNLSCRGGSLPAFPHENAIPDGPTIYYPGLTKREFFIAFALMGVISSENGGLLDLDDAAMAADEYADAILERLNGEENETN